MRHDRTRGCCRSATGREASCGATGRRRGARVEPRRFEAENPEWIGESLRLGVRGKRRRTATKLYSLSPCWDETLLFPVADPLDLPQSTIEVSVYHDNSNFNSTAQHRNSFLGRVRLSCSSVAPCCLDAALQLCPLNKRSFFSNVRGELTLRVYVVAEDDDVPVLNSVQAEAEADTVAAPSTEAKARENLGFKKIKNKHKKTRTWIYYVVIVYV
ncbi:hypothetical protein ZIOFF_043685 [Zingiber officinale]|uniref:C2 domain-containing protein n=1 Tax=Zingiber officinale TaxID=94328 RepID=A0A8J5FXS5_ZINOF|nr:hypothetical protein ZIOFF_043685 [Zingiber officinale]